MIPTRSRAGVVACLIALLLIAPGATGAVKSGFYKGKSSQPAPGNKLSFTIDGKKIENIKIKVRYPCNDGSEETFQFTPSDTTLDGDRKFTTAWVAGLGQSALLTMTGKVTKKGKASGETRFSASLPSGVSCDSGTLTWSAHRVKG